MRELSNSEQNLVSGGTYDYAIEREKPVPKPQREEVTPTSIQKGNRHYWLLGPFPRPFDNRYNLYTNFINSSFLFL